MVLASRQTDTGVLKKRKKRKKERNPLFSHKDTLSKETGLPGCNMFSREAF